MKQPPAKPTNVIDITRIVKSKIPIVNRHGMNVLKALPSQDADAAVGFILNMILTNIEVGLGIIDTDDDPELEKAIDEITDEDMIFFNKVNEIYNRAHGNCYFCRDDIDPNGEPITRETHICLRCTRKLGNFLEFIGIPREKVFRFQKSPASFLEKNKD